MGEGGFVELELIPSPGLALWREQAGEEEEEMGRRGRNCSKENTAKSSVEIWAGLLKHMACPLSHPCRKTELPNYFG